MPRKWLSSRRLHSFAWPKGQKLLIVNWLACEHEPSGIRSIQIWLAASESGRTRVFCTRPGSRQDEAFRLHAQPSHFCRFPSKSGYSCRKNSWWPLFRRELPSEAAKGCRRQESGDRSRESAIVSGKGCTFSSRLLSFRLPTPDSRLLTPDSRPLSLNHRAGSSIVRGNATSATADLSSISESLP